MNNNNQQQIPSVTTVTVPQNASVSTQFGVETRNTILNTISTMLDNLQQVLLTYNKAFAIPMQSMTKSIQNYSTLQQIQNISSSHLWKSLDNDISNAILINEQMWKEINNQKVTTTNQLTNMHQAIKQLCQQNILLIDQNNNNKNISLSQILTTNIPTVQNITISDISPPSLSNQNHKQMINGPVLLLNNAKTANNNNNSNGNINNSNNHNNGVTMNMSNNSRILSSDNYGHTILHPKVQNVNGHNRSSLNQHSEQHTNPSPNINNNNNSFNNNQPNHHHNNHSAKRKRKRRGYNGPYSEEEQNFMRNWQKNQTPQDILKMSNEMEKKFKVKRSPYGLAQKMYQMNIINSRLKAIFQVRILFIL